MNASNVAKKSTPTLILCAEQNSTDCTRNIVEGEPVGRASMGMKHTATLAEEGIVQLLQKGGGINAPTSQVIMKKGAYTWTIIDSSASPTESMPTKLTVQKITQPAELSLGEKVRRNKGDSTSAKPRISLSGLGLFLAIFRLFVLGDRVLVLANRVFRVFLILPFEQSLSNDLAVGMIMD